MPWHARLELDYQSREGRTVLHHRHEGPLRIFKSLYPEGPAICHNVLIHPPGGLVHGDRLDVEVRVGAGAHALLSTPGATRFYRSQGEAATQSVTLRLDAGARCEWVPLETLAYDGCHAVNALTFDLAPGAELLAWDVLSLGLPASAQPFRQGLVEQTLHWPGVWREQGRIDAADTRLLNSPLGLDGQDALATLVLACGSPLSPARREHLLDTCQAVLQAHPGVERSGVTCPNDRVLVVRALALQVEPLMQLWQTLWSALRRCAWDLQTEPPRSWKL